MSAINNILHHRKATVCRRHRCRYLSSPGNIPHFRYRSMVLHGYAIVRCAVRRPQRRLMFR